MSGMEWIFFYNFLPFFVWQITEGIQCLLHLRLANLIVQIAHQIVDAVRPILIGEVLEHGRLVVFILACTCSSLAHVAAIHKKEEQRFIHLLCFLERKRGQSC